MEKSVLHKAAEKRIVSISINTLMLLSIVGVFCTIKSENKFTQPNLSLTIATYKNIWYSETIKGTTAHKVG